MTTWQPIFQCPPSPNLTVGALKTLLAAIPDDTPIVICVTTPSGLDDMTSYDPPGSLTITEQGLEITR